MRSLAFKPKSLHIEHIIVMTIVLITIVFRGLTKARDLGTVPEQW